MPYPLIGSYMTYAAARSSVLNWSKPSTAFLDELVTRGRFADDKIFAPIDAEDVYSSVKTALGPWQGSQHRRAFMLEVMRVLAGFEFLGHPITGQARDSGATEGGG